MKIKEVLARQRLSPEEEITLTEINEHTVTPEKASTEELLSFVELMAQQIKLLEEEKNRLYAEEHRLERRYTEAAKTLNDFTNSRSSVVEVMTENEEGIKRMNIDSRETLLSARQLQHTDEVKEYTENREKLRNNIKQIAQAKKEAKETFSRFGDVSFRSSEREQSLQKMSSKAGEITGSIKALEVERKHALDILIKRAEVFWVEKKNILSEDMIEGAILFGIEASAEALEHVKEKITIQDVSFTNDGIKEKFIVRISEWAYSSDIVQRFAQRDIARTEEKEREMALQNISRQESEVAHTIKEKYNASLDNLPINIEVVTQNGYQGLYVTEGELHGAAWLYSGKTEYERAEKINAEKESELKKINNDIVEAERSLAKDIEQAPASFLNFSLRKKYKNAEQRIDDLKKRKQALMVEAKKTHDEMVRLEALITVEKEPIAVIENVKPIELNNYLYIHSNYGRGYEKARKNNAMQTVGDFFRIFIQKRQQELEAVQKTKNTFENDSFFSMYELLRKRIQEFDSH